MNRVFAEHNRRRHRPKSSLFKPEVQLFDRTFANVKISQNLPDKTINQEYVRWWWIILFVCNFAYNLLTSIYLFISLSMSNSLASFLSLSQEYLLYITQFFICWLQEMCSRTELLLLRTWHVNGTEPKGARILLICLSLYSFAIKDSLVPQSHIQIEYFRMKILIIASSQWKEHTE